MPALHDLGAVCSWSVIHAAKQRGFNAIWGSGANDIYVLSSNLALPNPISGEILHYDGVAFSAVKQVWGLPSAIWGAGPKAIYVTLMCPWCNLVGLSFAKVLHYNGTSWTPHSPLGNVDLFAVWGSGPNDVYVVGAGNKPARFDGKTWTTINVGATGLVGFSSVWSSGPNDLFVAGLSSVGTTIFHRTSSGWSASAPLKKMNLQDLWGSGPTDLFGVGYVSSQLGAPAHFDGSAWSFQASPAVGQLYAVRGSGPTQVFAIGSKIYMVFDGAAWHKLPWPHPDYDVCKGMWRDGTGSWLLVCNSHKDNSAAVLRGGCTL